IDLRGHGASTNTGDPKSYTFEQLAEDLIGFLDALGIERCDLLGHSMGGMVALRAVLARPERVASLILMDTAARAPDMDRGPIWIDLRGHGASTNTGDPKSYTFEQLAEDLIGFLDALGIERCDLLGHSMGGMVALRAVLARPERVASLILMDTAARAPDMDRGLLELAVRIAEEAGLEGLASAMRARARNDPARPEPDRRLEAEWGEGYWRDWRLPNLRDMDPAAYGALGAAIFDQAPLGARVGAIRRPTPVLVGARVPAFLAPDARLEAAGPVARG